jgi:transposase
MVTSFYWRRSAAVLGGYLSPHDQRVPRLRLAIASRDSREDKHHPDDVDVARVDSGLLQEMPSERCAVFCIVEPLTGMRLTFATANRKRPAFGRALQKIALRYLHARRIHLVLDNLNIHSLVSVVQVLGEFEGRRLWRRFVVHYTPKHASWLNAAEIEASLVSRECLGRQRISSLVDLISQVSAWRVAAQKASRTIDWKFRVNEARRLFRYDGLATARSEH